MLPVIKVKIKCSVMVQRLWLRWSGFCGPASEGLHTFGEALIPPLVLEAQNASNMVKAFDLSAKYLSVEVIQAIVATGAWFTYVLLSDKARANEKLINHIGYELQQYPNALVLAMPCAVHQCHKIVEAVVKLYNIINPMFCATHLLMLAATLMPLWAAVNEIVDEMEIFWGEKPPAEHAEYNAFVLKQSFLREQAKREACGQHARQATQREQKRQSTASMFGAFYNGDWKRGSKLQHYCWDADECRPCCQSEGEAKNKGRVLMFSVVFSVAPTVFALNKWASVSKTLSWYCLGFLCHNVLGQAWTRAFRPLADQHQRDAEAGQEQADPDAVGSEDACKMWGSELLFVYPKTP